MCATCRPCSGVTPSLPSSACSFWIFLSGSYWIGGLYLVHAVWAPEFSDAVCIFWRKCLKRNLIQCGLSCFQNKFLVRLLRSDYHWWISSFEASCLVTSCCFRSKYASFRGWSSTNWPQVLLCFMMSCLKKQVSLFMFWTFSSNPAFQLIYEFCKLKSFVLYFSVDPRVEDWLLMSSPFPQTMIILSYIYFVTTLGPRLMENRKPFDLKQPMIIYNFSIVAFSLYMIYEVGNHDWFCACNYYTASSL